MPPNSVPIELTLDNRLSSTSIRLYGLLRQGNGLESAAQLLELNLEHLKRYERELVRYGYIERVTKRTQRGTETTYNFPEPPALPALAS